MADELAPAEQPATEEILEQTPASDVSGSEADQPTTEPAERGKGDPWAAMHQERQKRQELESRLSDPMFIYEQAKALGLAGDDEGEEETRPQPQPVGQPSGMDYQTFRYFSELDKAKEKYPELATDDELGLMAGALMQKGLSPLAAAEKVMSRLNRVAEAAKTEGARAKEETISAKEQAQTVTAATNVDSDAAEVAALKEKAKDWRDPKGQEKAMLELMKRNIR